MSNRAAISVPRDENGMPRWDALIDGSNVEISPYNTLVRRPGFPKYLSSANFGAETPKGFYSAILSGALYNFLDTSAKVYRFTSSALTALYTKGTTNQTFYQQVGNLLFFSDGNANMKWDGGTNTDPTKNGIATPTIAPSVSNLNLYDAATQTVHCWVPKYTYSNNTGNPKQYYLMAPTGEIYWGVVPKGSSRKSQSSAPNWASKFGKFGGVIVDGQMTWANCLTPGTWQATNAYVNNTFKVNTPTPSTVTNSSPGSTGSGTFPWQIGGQSAGISNVGLGTTGNSDTLTFTSLGLSVPTNATILGVQASIARASNRSNSISDVTVKLLKANVAAGSNRAAAGYYPWTTGPDVYTIPTSGGTLQTYGSSTDMWGTTLTPSDVENAGFGVEFIINNNSTKDTVGALVYPLTVTVWYKVAGSDIPGVVYAEIVEDSNGNLQRVKTGGTSAGSEPSWSTTIGGTTTDGGVTWEMMGTANQLPTLFNRTYAYGFRSHMNAKTAANGHLSTMSPTLVMQAPIIGSNVPVLGYGSNDTQVDTVELYRSLDGGSLLLYNAATANVNAATSWTITDSGLDADLNEFLVGPVARANDPPPDGMTLLAYHVGRLWGVVGNLLYFSAGPDCTNGDGNQAWPPANVFTLPAPIKALQTTTQGLLVFTALETQVVLGGPNTLTFWLQPLFRNIGVQSPNCVAHDGDTVAAYTSQKQMIVFSPSFMKEIGFPVADVLAANFGPTSSYLAVHRSGRDQGLFISDGSTKVMRFNLNTNSWDAVAIPAMAAGPIASLDTSPGTRTLVGTMSGGYIVKRDPTDFQDGGTNYSAYATIGSLPLSEFGQDAPARVKSVVAVSSTAGTAMTVSVLPNEISGSFTTLPFTASDPWQLPASSTIGQNRYDWLGAQSPLPNAIRHLQVKITMPIENAKNEIYGVSLI